MTIITVNVLTGEVSQRDLTPEEVAALPVLARDLRAEIAELEAMVTPRRVREALLTGDTSFIEGIDAQIEALRGLLQ